MNTSVENVDRDCKSGGYDYELAKRGRIFRDIVS